MSIPSWLERVSIDWSKSDDASRISREMAQELASNRSMLRTLVFAAIENEQLTGLAEKHGELNYIVLYDALERGFRIRLHRFSKGLEDIPHNHRFSFSSALLKGSYIHTMFELQRQDTDPAADPWTLDQPEGSFTGDALGKLAICGLQEILQTRQSAGTSYTMNHHAIHKTAMPDEDAFSVFVRSPAQKECSLQLEPWKRTYRWKFGRGAEGQEVIRDRVMTTNEYRAFVNNLEEESVI